MRDGEQERVPGLEPRDWSRRTAVAGLFPDRTGAEAAIRALKSVGFTDAEIGVALRDRDERGELIQEAGGTKVGQRAATGAVSGGVLGGVLGLLVGVGALAIPGIGPVVAGGALASAFGVVGGTAAAGAGIGAATGGILGALIGMGIPEEEARRFETGVRAGGILLTVRAGGRSAEAAEIMERYGADTAARTYAATAGAESVPLTERATGTIDRTTGLTGSTGPVTGATNPGTPTARPDDVVEGRGPGLGPRDPGPRGGGTSGLGGE
ncbi:MAG TPA: hypothetical protein VNK43_01350 [Gemmatimonadales bacterium]|nr:hypothetical protein [Gemmatimonadales bacterium]